MASKSPSSKRTSTGLSGKDPPEAFAKALDELLLEYEMKVRQRLDDTLRVEFSFLQSAVSALGGRDGTASRVSLASGMFEDSDGSEGDVVEALQESDASPAQRWSLAEHIGPPPRKGILVEEPIMNSKGLTEESMGILATVIAIANNGKATRQAIKLDTRPWWARNKEACAEWFMTAMILLNTVSLGVSADLHAMWAGWIVIDSGFAGFFFLAMVVKMWSSGLKRYFSHDVYWNWFEIVVVMLAVLEVAIAIAAVGTQDTQDTAKLPLLRVLRLTRIARIVRVCRLSVFSDLTMMINGAVGSMRTLLWSMFLIALPVYGMALLLRESLGGEVGEGAEGFQTVMTSFFTVFRCLVANECTTVEGKPIFVLVSSEYGWALAMFYCLVTVLMTFGLYNVIMAIYVENIVAAAKYNDLHQKRKRFLDCQVFAEKVIKLVDFICRVHRTCELSQPSAEDESNTSNSIDLDELSLIEITPDFFELLRTFREFQELLNDLDIADEDQFDLFNTLDIDGSGAIDLEELVVGICKLRGPAKRSDIIGVDLVVRATQRSVEKVMQQFAKQATFLNTIQVGLRDCNQALRSLQADGVHSTVSRASSKSRQPSLAASTGIFFYEVQDHAKEHADSSGEHFNI